MQTHFQELIEPWQAQRSATPAGYDNVADLFTGIEIFEEIMKVSDREFKVAFYTEQAQDGGECGSKLTEAWVAALIKQFESHNAIVTALSLQLFLKNTAKR